MGAYSISITLLVVQVQVQGAIESLKLVTGHLAAWSLPKYVHVTVEPYLRPHAEYFTGVAFQVYEVLSVLQACVDMAICSNPTLWCSKLCQTPPAVSTYAALSAAKITSTHSDVP